MQTSEDKLRENERESQQLSHSLVQNIRQFEAASNLRNFRAFLTAQIRLVETWIQAKDGVQSEEEMVKNLMQTKTELDTMLNVIDELHPDAVPPPPPPPPAPNNAPN